MFKLLHSNFSRLFKGKCLWLCLAAQAAVMVFVIISLALKDDSKVTSDLLAANSFYMSGLPVGTVLLAIISSLFIGADYHYGTIRNKLITGEPRYKIYLANLITVSAAALMLLAVNLLFLFAVDLPVFGRFTTKGGYIFAMLVCGTIAYLACAAIMTAVNMTAKNMTASVIILLVGIIVSLMLMNTLYNEAYAPDTYKSFYLDELGNEHFIEIPNPRKCAPWLAAVYKFILTVFPGGQFMLILQGRFIGDAPDAALIWQTLVSSIAVTGLTTAAGLAVFNGENLK